MAALLAAAWLLAASSAPSARGAATDIATRSISTPAHLGTARPVRLSSATTGPRPIAGEQPADAAEPASQPIAGAQPTALPTGLPEHYRLVDVWSSTETERYPYHPEGIDVAADGLIYVAERGRHSVSVWHQNGDAEDWLGTQGDGPGELQAPEDVAVDNERDRLYVADTGNRRVQVLDRRSGAHVATWDAVGRPRGIAVGTTGRVYITDVEGHQVRVFDPDGTAVATWGGLGRAPGELRTPLGLTVGPDAWIYVADADNQRVQWFAPDGTVVGALELDNRAHPGGRPLDVAVDADGELYVAVARGVLRFRDRTAYVETLRPIRQTDAPDCPVPGRCPQPVPLVGNHEGVRRVAVAPRLGLFVTYAPSLRFGDRILRYPARGEARVVGARETGPSWRRAYDPSRIDAGADPYHAHALDTSGLARTYRANGRWYDSRHGFAVGAGGVDIAADGVMPWLTTVISGNLARVQSLRCFLGCAPAEIPILDPSMMTRRNRTGDRIPDATWWNRTVAARGALAVLDAGRGRLIVRDGFRCMTSPHPCDPPSECKRHPEVQCPANPVDRPLIGAVTLNPPADAFRAFTDVAIDASGDYWVLARDGGIVHIDASGRAAGERTLAGLAPRTAEALAVDTDGASYVLTDDGRIHKHDPQGRPRAAWDIAAEAGPGRYRDLTVDAGGRVLVPDGAQDRILVFAQGPDDEPTPTPDDGAGCDVTPDKRAAPERLTLGQTTEVTLELTADCRTERRDVVLVVDVSCQMGGDRLAPVRAAGAALVAAMDRPGDKLGLVTFSDQLGGARLAVPPTADRAAMREAVGSLTLDCLPSQLDPGRQGDGRISDGLRAGREALLGPHGRPDAGKALVLVSSSLLDRALVERYQFGRWLEGSIAPEVSERQHAMLEAWRLWDAGVTVYSVGVGQGERRIGPPPPPTPDLRSTHPPDAGLLASMARPADGYRFAEAEDEALAAVLSAIGHELSDAPSPRFETLEIIDRLPANMPLVPGSADPPPETLPDGALRWTFVDVGPGGPPAIRYRVEPQDAGRWPTNIEAVAVYTDGLGYPGRTVFPVPQVEVVAPTPSSTATSTATDAPTSEPTPTDQPTVTGTATASATAVATVTSIPSGSPTPAGTPSRVPSPSATATDLASRTPDTPPTVMRGPIYLPITVREGCQPTRQPLDIALAIDTSSSMTGAKLDAALGAAREFVALLDVPRDQAAVVTFSGVTQTRQTLTGDRAALDAALRGVSTAVGTRIDRGLLAALEALSGSGARAGASQAIVLLTDGRPQGGSEAATRLAAGQARERGVAVYAIGLGADVDHDWLQQIAGQPDRVYVAPTPAELAAIYRGLARRLPCR